MHHLKLPALEIRQTPNQVFYSFAVDGKLLPRFATITRIRRPEGQEIAGYQRPEVLSHISEIRTYLESSQPLLPNSIVLAFDGRVTFEAKQKASGLDYVRIGVITIPIDEALEDNMKPGWIVDGQQRMAAIREAAVDHFPISVTAFLAASEREQREQFILVNSTKPLPKGLIYELLPTTEMKLPTALEKKRFPAHLLTALNSDPTSPLKGLVRTPTNPTGLLQDNSLLKMLENSLSDGVLYRFQNPSTGDANASSMLMVLKSFWAATAVVFKEAWAQPPRRSRLMHGAGIVSMGFVMDAIAERHRSDTLPTSEQFAADLEPLKPVCRWTDGYWDFGPNMQRKWNEIQNTPKDVQLLANHLLSQYKARVWSRQASVTR